MQLNFIKYIIANSISKYDKKYIIACEKQVVHIVVYVCLLPYLL